jgi:hypothetical protein
MSSTTSSPDPGRQLDLREAHGVQVGDYGSQENTFNLHIPKGVRNAAIILVIAALLAGAGWVVVTWVLPQFDPNYKTQFLIDTSSDADRTEAIAASLATAVGNSADHDALALRTFGGECGAEDNTTQLVDFDTDNRQQILDAAAGVATSDKATLLRGIVQAAEDFSGPFTRSPKQVSRVIVVTQHGMDACDEDTAFVAREIRNRVAAAGLGLEFRFVGYQVPDGERDQLTDITSAAGAPDPTFADNPAELDAAVDWLTNTEPVLRDAQKIIDVLNPTVDRVNTAVQEITDGRFDAAESTLEDARSAVAATETELENLADRSTPEARDIHDRAVSLRARQEEVVAAAGELLDAARSHASFDAESDAFQRVANDYNREIDAMNDVIAKLRATAAAGSR